MDRIVKAGIIGCGVISGVHLRALGELPSVEVAALCDVDRARLKAAATLCGPEVELTDDYRRIIAREDIDSIHVLTPHYLHARMTIDALEAGKYVLCEKPMATSKADARAMIEADHEHRLGMIFQNRYNAATARAKEIIDSGMYGKITAIKGSVTWRRDAEYYRSGPWRGKWATEGGGVLINQAIHTIDQVIYLGGALSAVKGSVSRDFLEDPYEVEDNAHAVFAFESGHRALFYASNSYVQDDPPTITICLERGRISILGDCLYDETDNHTKPLIVPESFDNGAKAVYGNSHLPQIADYYRCMREGRRYWLDGAEAYPAIWAVLSIYESSRKGQWISYDSGR